MAGRPTPAWFQCESTGCIHRYLDGEGTAYEGCRSVTGAAQMHVPGGGASSDDFHRVVRYPVARLPGAHYHHGGSSATEVVSESSPVGNSYGYQDRDGGVANLTKCDVLDACRSHISWPDERLTRLDRFQ